MANAIISLKLK